MDDVDVVHAELQHHKFMDEMREEVSRCCFAPKTSRMLFILINDLYE